MSRFLAFRTAFRTALVLSWFAAVPVQSQPAGSLGEYFIYRVQPGDTLIALAQTYTRDSRSWRQLQTLNKVEDPYRMPVALALRIPLSLIPRETTQARLVHVQGSVRIGNAPARAGEPLAQGSTLSTADGGYATLELEDGTLMTLPPNTDLHLDQLSKFQGTNLTDTVIQMPRGSLETTAAPSGSGVGRFEVRTPVAVTGVRGTHFRVENTTEGLANSVTVGSVRLQTRSGNSAPGAPILVRDGYGSVVRADGTLAGTWQLLPAPAVSEPVRTAGRWVASITPVAGAAAYQTTVSRDPQGHLVVSSANSRNTDIRVATPGVGTYHLTVRAIDDHGIHGHHTRFSLTTRNVLTDNRDHPVTSGAGTSTQLSDY